MNDRIEIDITQKEINVDTNDKINVINYKVDLTNYYTIPETDLKFLSKEQAQNTYATISSVNELSNIINSNREIIDSIQSEINVMKESLVNVKSNADEAKNKAQEAYDLALEIDGSPRGVYANLSALQTALPSGANGVYITEDDGYWNYWNGTEWKKGAVYQSSKDIKQIKENINGLKGELVTKASNTALNNEINRATNRENEIEALFKAPTQEAVNAWLNAHPEASTTVQDNSITSNKINSEFKEWIRGKKTINVCDYGAKADGITDDSSAIKTAIGALPKNNGVLYIPSGIYIHGDGVSTKDDYTLISGTNTPENTQENANRGADIVLKFDGFTNLTILGYGAEIRSNDNNSEIRNNAIFEFWNCDGVTIKGLKINGRRQERKCHLNDATGNYKFNLRSNLGFYGSCKNIVLEDIESINSAMDGICSDTMNWNLPPMDNFTLLNCKFNNNHRQGFSPLGVTNLKIISCDFSFNGSSGDNYSGTLPKSGIDLESNKDVPNKDIIIQNCKFDSNSSVGLIISNYNTNVLIDGCTFIKSGCALVEENINDTKAVNCIFENCLHIPTGFDICSNNIFNIDLANNSKTQLFVYDEGTTCSREKWFENNVIKLYNHNANLEVVGIRNSQSSNKIHFKNNIISGIMSTSEGTSALWLKYFYECIGNTFISYSDTFNDKTVLNYVTIDPDLTNTRKVCNNHFIGKFSNFGSGLSINASLETDTEYKQGLVLDFLNGKLYKIQKFNKSYDISVHSVGEENHIKYGHNAIASQKYRHIITRMGNYRNGHTPVSYYYGSDGYHYILVNEAYVRLTFTIYNELYKDDLEGVKNNPLLELMSSNDVSGLTLVEPVEKLD